MRNVAPHGQLNLAGCAALRDLIVALEKAQPHIKRWWNERAVSFIKSKWVRLAGADAADGQGPDGDPPVVIEAVAASSSEEVAALSAYRASVTSAEARERLLAALVARHFSGEQLRILRSVQVEGEGDSSELVRAVEALTPKQVEDSLRLILEANISLPDAATSAEFVKALVEGPASEVLAPSRQESLTEASRLTDGDS